MINLKATNKTEEVILKYLNENASEVLTDKINNGTKTLTGCINFLCKEAQGQSKGANSACVEDNTVFGWAIHYFEEDTIKENKKVVGKVKAVKEKPITQSEPKVEVKKVEVKHEQKIETKKEVVKPNNQLNIFDLLGV